MYYQPGDEIREGRESALLWRAKAAVPKEFLSVLNGCFRARAPALPIQVPPK